MGLLCTWWGLLTGTVIKICLVPRFKLCSQNAPVYLSKSTYRVPVGQVYNYYIVIVVPSIVYEDI